MNHNDNRRSWNDPNESLWIIMILMVIHMTYHFSHFLHKIHHESLLTTLVPTISVFPCGKTRGQWQSVSLVNLSSMRLLKVFSSFCWWPAWKSTAASKGQADTAPSWYRLKYSAFCDDFNEQNGHYDHNDHNDNMSLWNLNNNDDWNDHDDLEWNLTNEHDDLTENWWMSRINHNDSWWFIMIHSDS